MARMTAIDAAVLVLEKEGITCAFGIPGAAINPLYAAMKRRGSIAHVLARHVEGASHMAEGYTRAMAGNIGVCIGTSGPAGTDMITGLYSAQADSIPILCITGQAPRARLYKEDFQAVDIESISKPVTKWSVTVREPAQVPRAFQQAFHLMRSGRPGPVLIDLPFDVQIAEIEFDIDTYEPLPVYKPKATRAQIEKAMAMLNDAERPLIIAGGGVINADASELLVEFAEITGVPVIPTLMGWGIDSRRSSADGGHGRPADQPSLRQRDDARVRFRARHRQSLGQPPHGLGRRVHEGPQVRPRRHRAHADRPRVRTGLRNRLGREGGARALRRGRARMEGGRPAQGSRAWVAECQERKRTMLRKTNFENVPMKPQRVYQCLNRAFDDKDTCYVTTIGLSQIAAAQFLHVYKPRHWINCGQAGPLGWTIPAALGVRVADPTRRIVALSGDYDFQFMIEELAVGAQFNLPYIHIVVNNAYLGLIRQAQRGFDMDYCVQLGVRQRQRARDQRLRRRPRRRRRRPGLQGDPRAPAGGDRPGDRSRRKSGWPSTRCPVVIEIMLERDHEHRDGHRDRQGRRVRGAGGEHRRRADGRSPRCSIRCRPTTPD